MNKLILIGNGFDLAHGLKTDYNSFIKWFVTRCFREASFEDENAPEQPIHVSNQIFEISASMGKFYTMLHPSQVSKILYKSYWKGNTR